MLLNEFFGRAIKVGRKDEVTKDQQDLSDQANEVFWFILDHDRLHKDYFYPIADKMKEAIDSGKADKDEFISNLKPMVEKGCMEFYHHHKLKGKPEKLFPKDLRKDICEKLFDHYYEAIKKGEYELG